MGWFGPSGSCGCCTPACDCEVSFPDGVTAGLGGIEADVTGTYVNLSCTASSAGACGWNCSDRECQASGASLIRLFGPSSCPPGGENPLDLGLFYGPTLLNSLGDTTGCTGTDDRWAIMALTLGVSCVGSPASPLWQATFSWGYSVYVRNTIFSPPFDCYTYDITTDLIGSGYSSTGTNQYGYTSGDPFSGDYVAHSAVRVGTGSNQRWNISCSMTRSSADPADLIGYSASGFAPLFNPVGSTMSGTVL